MARQLLQGDLEGKVSHTSDSLSQRISLAHARLAATLCGGQILRTCTFERRSSDWFATPSTRLGDPSRFCSIRRSNIPVTPVTITELRSAFDLALLGISLPIVIASAACQRLSYISNAENIAPAIMLKHLLMESFACLDPEDFVFTRPFSRKACHSDRMGG